VPWLLESATVRLKAAIGWLISNIADDRLLHERLRELAAEPRFAALWWYWAPQLHARNAALFRPFIRQHHSRRLIEPGGFWRRWRTEPIAWRGEVAATLEPWLATLESRGEVELFRLLYLWKHQHGAAFQLDERRWRADLAASFAAAAPAARARVLELHDIDGELDEAAAALLYAIDAPLARPFILKHLSPHRPWRRLAEAARVARDEDFALQLHRSQVPFRQWQQEALALGASTAEPAELVEALERRHPASAWSGDFGRVCCQLLEARGEDVLPYVYRHLRSVRREAGREELARLARLRGWSLLWAAVRVICGTVYDYNDAIRGVLQDWRLPELERLRCLVLLSGVSREWRAAGLGPPRVRPLSTPNALALYAWRPQLLTGLFAAHLLPTAHDSRVELFARAWEQGDEALADTLASRYITGRVAVRRAGHASVADFAAEKYRELQRDAADFARRAAAVLTRIPAGSIRGYQGLIRVNRLARLLFEGPLRSFLDVPGPLGDLLVAPESHVQQLAFKVLCLPDPRARELAGEHLDRLLVSLLAPLPRRVRFAAFGALENAATGLEAAGQILARAREACRLRARGYPQEQLVGLMGRLLARHPSLAAPGEVPVIYRHAGSVATGARRGLPAS
jgi:hypothetical protein